MASTTTGDLNNKASERIRKEVSSDPAYKNCSFAISPSQDDARIRTTYRPFLLKDAESSQDDWVAQLELNTVLKMVDTQVIKTGDERVKVLVLYGSMRKR